MVDPPSGCDVPELVSGHMHSLTEFVCDTTHFEPLSELPLT
jgi:hypothetical protein